MNENSTDKNSLLKSADLRDKVDGKDLTKEEKRSAKNEDKNEDNKNIIHKLSLEDLRIYFNLKNKNDPI